MLETLDTKIHSNCFFSVIVFKMGDNLLPEPVSEVQILIAAFLQGLNQLCTWPPTSANSLSAPARRCQKHGS